MAVPIANAGTSPAAQAFSVLPTAQALSFSGTVGTGGTSITHYKSVILDKPAGSVAALSSTTINNPNLTPIDTQGTVTVFLRVADDRFNNALAPDPWLHPDNAAYVSEANPALAPTSAFVHVSIKTEVLDIEIPSTWQRDTLPQYVGFVEAVEELGAAAAFGGLLAPPFTVYATAGAGPVDADGSITRPFNATSAANVAADGPIEQGVAALTAMDVSATPTTPRTLVVAGGAYNEDFIITAADGPWKILTTGRAVFDAANTFKYTAAATADILAAPHLTIAPLSDEAEGALVFLGGVTAFQLGNPDAEVWNIRLDCVVLLGMSVQTTFAAGPLLNISRSFVGLLNIPNLAIKRITDCLTKGSYSGAWQIVAKNIDQAINAWLDDITVTVASTDADAGFYNCAWGSTPVFTGPAGSAKFDLVTAANFVFDTGSFASGAGLSDALKVGDLQSAAAAWKLQQTGSGTMTLETASGALLLASGGGAAVSTATYLNLITTDGSITANVSGAGQAVNLLTADGNIVIDANGAGRDVLISADDGIALTSVGALALNAGGHFHAISSNGHAILQSTGAAQYALVEASDGRVDIAANGTAHNVNITTTDGNIALTAVGSGRSIALVAPTITLNGVDAATLNRTLYSQYLNVPTIGTSEELLGSWPIPAGFFVTAGMRIEIEAIYDGANSGLSKDYTLKLDGTVLATLNASTANNRVRIKAAMIATGSAAQRVETHAVINGSAIIENMASLTKNMASSRTIQAYGTSANGGEVVLISLSVDFKPAVA